MSTINLNLQNESDKFDSDYVETLRLSEQASYFKIALNQELSFQQNKEQIRHLYSDYKSAWRKFLGQYKRYKKSSEIEALPFQYFIKVGKETAQTVLNAQIMFQLASDHASNTLFQKIKSR